MEKEMERDRDEYGRQSVCVCSSRLTPLAAWQTSDSLQLSLTQLCKNTHRSPFSKCTHIYTV